MTPLSAPPNGRSCRISCQCNDRVGQWILSPDILRDSAGREGVTPHTSTLAKARASVKNSRAGAVQAPTAFCGAKSSINFRPARAHTDASRVGKMSSAEHWVHRSQYCCALVAGFIPTAKFPDKIVVWILRPLRSSHLRGIKGGQGRGTQRLVRPLRLCSRRCRQYTPPVGRRHHVAHRAPPEGIAHGELFCSRIELDDRIRFTPDSLYQTARPRDSDSVGTGVRSAGEGHI